MLRARAPLAVRVVPKGALRALARLPEGALHPTARSSWGALRRAAQLASLAFAASACSLSGGGTGGHTEQVSPNEPIDPLDAEVGPIAQRDAGLDARVQPADSGAVDASRRLDAASEAGAIKPPPDTGVNDASPGDDAGLTVDAGTFLDAGPVDGAVPDTGASDAGLSCSLSDQFALRIDLQVKWAGTALEGIIPVLAPGTGVLSMFASLDLRAPQGAGREAVLSPCGTIIPDFAAGNNTYKGELYSVQVPDAAWDAPQMPRWRVPFSAACDEPGCAFRTDALLAMLGARTVPAMPPRTPAGIELADHDGDGLPSVTFLARGPSAVSPGGKPYAYPPLFAPWIRARKMMLAIGISGQMDGTVSNCGTINGVVNQPVFETGAVACTGVVEGNNPNEQTCTSEFVDFLDENMPQWTVTSASFKAQRIGTASCAAVRAALP